MGSTGKRLEYTQRYRGRKKQKLMLARWERGEDGGEGKGFREYKLVVTIEPQAYEIQFGKYNQ